MMSAAIIPALLLSTTAISAPAPDDHMRIELISDDATIAPGKSVTLGLHLIHEAHWHTYWINPGDSGLPTKLSWQLPNGYAASDIAWPTPERFAVGDLTNFGYDGDVVLPIKIDVPLSAKSGGIAHFEAEAKWLVCREECVPGKATLAIDVPIRDAVARNPKTTKPFDAAHAQQPQPAAWNGGVRIDGDRVVVTLDGAGIPLSENLDAFVVQRRVVNNASPKIASNGNSMTLTFAKSDYFVSAPPQLDLVLRSALANDIHAWSITLPFRSIDRP